MAILTVVTITNGDLNELEKTAKSFINSDDIQWVVVSSEDTYPLNTIHPDKFIGNSNEGIFRAMNQGLKASQGEIIWFMNAGDTFYSNENIEAVCRLYKTLRWNWACGIAIRSDGSEWLPRRDLNLRMYFGTNSNCHQATIYNKEWLIKNFNEYDETSLFSDWLLSLRAIRDSTPFIIDMPLCVYDVSGISSKVNTSYRIWEPLRLRRKYKIAQFPLVFEIVMQIAVVTLSKLKSSVNV